MEISIHRWYFANGTNGDLVLNGKLICHTIVLPWKENEHAHSCIPEGSYRLTRRFTEHLGHHFLVENVPGRDLILIHPANDALKELKGCIAPVTELLGHGLGSESRKALDCLISLADAEAERLRSPGFGSGLGHEGLSDERLRSPRCARELGQEGSIILNIK